MDYGTYRGIYTLILLILFLGIVYWSYSSKTKKEFKDIAESILDDDDVNDTPNKKESSNGND